MFDDRAGPSIRALALVLRCRDRDQLRFERAAVRWHGRLFLEARGLSTADAGLALAALRALAIGERVPAAEALASLLDAYGLAREDAVLRAWLDDASEGLPPPTT